MHTSRWWRLLVWSGTGLSVVGSLDPLEGSLLILPGIGLAALGAWLARGPFRLWLPAAFLSTALGVGLLWYISSLGGVGGDHGLSLWWALLLLPYPIGWLGGLVLSLLWLRQSLQRKPT
ncbi:MAG: hypothetical protein WC326_13800 [Candidatus Delongbacteria bacterium]